MFPTKASDTWRRRLPRRRILMVDLMGLMADG
jgi:hypothetical protein